MTMTRATKERDVKPCRRLVRKVREGFMEEVAFELRFEESIGLNR